MNLEFTHKPNYFLNAQLLIRFIEEKVKKSNTQLTEIKLSFDDLKKIFQGNFASSTTNLEGILNIADAYTIDTLNGDKAIIERYEIDFEEKHLHLFLNADANSSIKEGNSFFQPDSSSYE